MGIAELALGDTLSDQELRGKRIFVEGQSESGSPITATVSRGATPITASILPCVGCHGEDGKGRPEGGVVPPDISWKHLSAAHGHEHAYGRRHPAFDDVSLVTAILRGRDPGGNQLDIAMPRYDMSDADMADLIAYLKRIDSDLDPGLTGDSIRIGSLLPMEGPLASVGASMRQILEASFAEVNAGGGIHGRRIELVVAGYDQDLQQSVWVVRDLLQSKSVFAMVGGYTAGIEEAMADTAEELEVPMVGAFTQFPPVSNELRPHSFYLTSGIVQQASVLARVGANSAYGNSGRMAVIHPPDSGYSEVIEAIEMQLDVLTALPLMTISYQPGYLDATDVAETLKAADIAGVVFLGSARELKRLANRALEQDYMPDLMLPGLFSGSEMFEIDPAFEGHVLIGYSTTPSDHTPAGVREFEQLHEAHNLGYEHSAAQISAYVAAKVFAEGLKRAGRALSREKLIEALESLTNFQAGLMPSISYNSRKRIGAYGGYVLELDLQAQGFRPASNWISLQR